MDNAQAAAEIQRYLAEIEAREQAETLVKVASQLNAQLDLDASLSAVCRLTAEMMEAPIVTISLYDEECQELTLAYDVGLSPAFRRRIESLPRAVYEQYVAPDNNVVIASDVQALPDLPNAEIYRELDLRTTVGVSMLRGEELIGRLNVGTIGEVREFDENELNLLRGIADQAAIAIHRARLHERVQHHAAELEARVKERTEALETANAEKDRALEALQQHADQLRARNQELDAFVHTVAHDLQNPLSAIVTYAHVLRNMEEEKRAEHGDEYLEAILHGARKTMDIIEELLLLANVRKEDVESRPMHNMAQIVDEARRRLAAMIETSNAVIQGPDMWPVALGYGPWVEEIWENYLSNAIKYGGDPPHVEIGAEERADGFVRFWVRDNGSGLASEDAVTLFTPFTQLHQVRTRGHGLGLSIVRRITEKLNGRVGVDSQPGRGSVFYFELPVADRGPWQ